VSTRADTNAKSAGLIVFAGCRGGHQGVSARLAQLLNGRNGYGTLGCCSRIVTARIHVRLLLARRKPEGAVVSVIEIAGLVLALGLGVYLGVALLKPEKFQ